jgi:molecular chaperone DnaK
VRDAKESARVYSQAPGRSNHREEKLLPSSPMRLFVSYAHVDAVRVSQLGKDLSGRGFDVWYDDRLEPGDDWKAELIRRIHACDAFMYVSSTDAVESEWCQWELDQAIALTKFIVPVLVRPGTQLPRTIAHLQYVDASGDGLSVDLAKLVDRLVRLGQIGAQGTVHEATPRGFPARFTRPLPKTYRTVSQGYLRPAPPHRHRHPYQWPEQTRSANPNTGPIVGIDFGTSTSAVALYRDGQVTLIPNDRGETSTPSAVAIAENGTPLVGEGALEFLLRRPDRGVLEVKRLFGREVAKELGGPPVLEIDGMSYQPTDLAAFVFSKLRSDADAFIGTPVTRAVLTVPAHFNQDQLVTLMTAARLGGLHVMRVISEPVAACLAVHDRTSEEDRVRLVYDLGGGTFDVSLVECGPGVCEVKAVNGDTHLGGADFDRVVVDYCIDEFNKLAGCDLRSSATALMRVRDQVERAKIDLSSARSVMVNVPFVAFTQSGGVDLSVQLTRTRYNELTHALVARTLALTRVALEDAGAAVGDLDEIVVVGRAARTPSVRVALADMFGNRLRIAHDHLVAVGAAVEAGVLDGKVKDVLLLDTLTNTLRVQVAGGGTVPVIVRHSTIPTLIEMNVDGPASARTAQLRILAGESSWANRNFPLMEIELPREAKHGAATAITLTFDIDANSSLSVKATDQASGTVRQAVLGLRGGVSEDAGWADLHEIDADNEGLLPVFRHSYLPPIPEVALTEVSRVQRWLADATSSLLLMPNRHRARHARGEGEERERAKQIREWLRSNPNRDVPADIGKWSPFRMFAVERELLVDAIEQRVGVDLLPLRYCLSIADMADRLVNRMRESRR